VGRHNRGMGSGIATLARVAAAPLVLALAVTALPGRTRSPASSAQVLRERAAAVATSPDGAAVEASLARLLSDPALGRRLEDALARPRVDAFARELLHAALTVSRSSSALAGRLLGTPATTVDRERLDLLARDLRSSWAVVRLRDAGATLQHQPWPTRLAVDRTRATLDALAGVTPPAPEPADPLLGGVQDTAAFRSAAGALARVLGDDGADAFFRSLPPLVAAGLLDGSALDALGGPAPDRASTATADEGNVRLAAALVIVADGVVDGRPQVVATAITTAIAFSSRREPAGP
jgi:hypothetical protein